MLRTILRTYGAPPPPAARGSASASASPLLMKVLLTGTPVQNDIMELFWLCNFVMPAVFNNPQDFARIYRCGAGCAAARAIADGLELPLQRPKDPRWPVCAVRGTRRPSPPPLYPLCSFIGLGTRPGASFVASQQAKNRILSKLHSLLSRYMLRRVKGACGGRGASG